MRVDESKEQAGRQRFVPRRQKGAVDGMDTYWAAEAVRILRAELARRGVSYRKLAQLFAQRGYPETERAIANKVYRGQFSFAFFLRVMRVLDVEWLSVGPANPVGGVRHSQAPGAKAGGMGKDVTEA